MQQVMSDVFAKIKTNSVLSAAYAGIDSDTPDVYAQFIGSNIGCSDNSVPKFNLTNPAPDLKALHADVGVTQAQFDAFTGLVGAELASFSTLGVGMSAANIAKVQAFLSATSADVCEACSGFQSQSLCEKWANGAAMFKGDQTKMMKAIVTGTFTAFTSDTGLIAYFNGTTPCGSRDFIGNRINQGVLVNQLVAFFGSAGVLGCTQSSFPQYTGNTDMGVLHAFMPIPKATFDFFVSTLIGQIQSAVGPAASADDISAVRALLASPGVSVICNQPDCLAPRGTFSPTSQCATDVAILPGGVVPGGVPGSPNAPGAPGGVPVGGDASTLAVGTLVAALAALAAI